MAVASITSAASAVSAPVVEKVASAAGKIAWPAIAAAPVSPSGAGWFDPGTLSFEVAKGLPAAFVALVIGLVAAWIAWRQLQVAAEQKRVAHAKLNFDLFQQRYEIFEYTWAMLSSMIQPRPNQASLEVDFANARPRARFLFGGEVAEHMEEISRRSTEQQMIMVRTAASGTVMLPEDQQHYLANSKFFEEALRGARDLFGKYLDFSEWR